MTILTREPRQAEPARPDGLEALVGEQVLHSIGEPPGLLRVQSRRLWGDFYRVNVYVGPDVTAATVAASFFVRADGEGRVLTADPALTKRYGLATRAV